MTINSLFVFFFCLFAGGFLVGYSAGSDDKEKTETHLSVCTQEVSEFWLKKGES
jgi:hypothetical protein